MALPAKRHIWNNIPLKVISLTLGYTFWYIFSSSHVGSLWVTVPLTFYNIPTTHSIVGPETVTVRIAGKRSEIRTLDFENIAIYVDAQSLKKGRNCLAITEEQLFLPSSIKLVHYCPSNPIIELVSDFNRAQ